MNHLYEYVGNLHMHTPYSDGEAYHAPIAAAARTAGLDFIVVTDHNMRVTGVEGYYGDAAGGHTLLLTGEEIHDQARLPQVNHCLVYGVGRELAQCAANPQELIDSAIMAGGSAFLAHPTDPPITWVHESAIPWVDWDVERYTGLEIWNYMSGFKTLLPDPIRGAWNVFNPRSAVIGPPPSAIALWDRLLGAGRQVAAIGNSDAHGTRYHVGPISKIVFPYEFLFRCVNTHILSAAPFTGDWQADQRIVYQAVRAGRMFIGYGVAGDPRGFRFTAEGVDGVAQMGERIALGAGVTLHVTAPARAHLRLIRHGETVAEARDTQTLRYTARQPGAYRVEAWRVYRGRARCWILSNPIYVV